MNGNWPKPIAESWEKLPWSSEQRVYEWRPSYTDENAPYDIDLEEDLFSSENRINSGINFKNYASIRVSVKDGPPDLIPLSNLFWGTV
ncbi:hypothetical protein BGZ76_005937 [Entomortierella beljakovae]|nr:hypothetical protein BGZ76_005937 [Entomortierella beljakovae]